MGLGLCDNDTDVEEDNKGEEFNSCPVENLIKEDFLDAAVEHGSSWDGTRAHADLYDQDRINCETWCSDNNTSLSAAISFMASI